MSKDLMATHGAFCWVEFQGPDAGAAQTFYEKVVGWSVADLPMPEGNYPGIMVGGAPVGGFSPKPTPTASWLVYITVDDVDARTKAATQAGATIVSQPTNAPGVGRIAVIQDPFGAHVAFIKSDKTSA